IRSAPRTVTGVGVVKPVVRREPVTVTSCSSVSAGALAATAGPAALAEARIRRRTTERTSRPCMTTPCACLSDLPPETARTQRLVVGFRLPGQEVARRKLWRAPGPDDCNRLDQHRTLQGWIAGILGCRQLQDLAHDAHAFRDLAEHRVSRLAAGHPVIAGNPAGDDEELGAC